jgi:hypothetical protein
LGHECDLFVDFKVFIKLESRISLVGLLQLQTQMTFATFEMILVEKIPEIVLFAL